MGYFSISTDANPSGQKRALTYIKITADPFTTRVQFLQHTPVFIPQLMKLFGCKWNADLNAWERSAFDPFYASAEMILSAITQHQPRTQNLRSGF